MPLLERSIAMLMGIWMLITLSGCERPTIKPDYREFAAITNKSSWDCVNANDETAVPKCVIEGKLIITDPTKNITYVLYRPEDKTQATPIVCTLPAQAAAALSSSSSLGLSVPVSAAGAAAALSASATQSQTAQLISLGNNAAAALYVLAASFELCMAYGFDAIDQSAFAPQFSDVLKSAASLSPAAAAPAAPPAPKGDAAGNAKAGGAAAAPGKKSVPAKKADTGS